MSWDRAEAVRLYQSGIGPREVARLVDGPYATVYDHITKNRSKLRILVADIETAPTRAFIWNRWKQDIYQNQIICEGYVLCWAARWLGSDMTMTDSLFKNKTAYWKDTENDKNVVASMWRLLNEADIVIFHNGDGFDIPVLNTRFLLHGFNRPSSYKSIDTLKIAKRAFKFPSNSLNSLAIYLGLGKKMDTGGFDLWTGCMNGWPDAWEKMVSYCAADTELLEKVYLKLRPWDHRHPNVRLYMDDKSGCGVCGSAKLRKEDKKYYTSVAAYDVYRCAEPGCGALSRSRKSSLSKEDREHLRTNVGK